MVTNFVYIPALPLVGFFLLLFFGRVFPRKLSAVVGVGSILLSAGLTAWVLIQFLGDYPHTKSFEAVLWTWFLNTRIAFQLDALSLLMVTVITFVGSLIALYSVSYMEHDEDFSRFFAEVNLFVASMLVLVLADNYLLLFLGWEGVGVCSYLLIGFWYKESANGHAAIKAFLTTRAGDVAFLVGILTLLAQFDTLNIAEVQQQAVAHFPSGSLVITVIAFCLLGGAVGKSAQLPLQTWLPDAMLGPTPVSALIHAATMVTAGVYLIARNHVLFTLAPAAQTTVLAIGAATLLIAGLGGLGQRDLKRVLAYSTISQIGYMFLGLGAGAFTAAMFHFASHACFKALLFLGAGAIGHALEKDFDMANMGGLRKSLPSVFWPFLIGGLALSGFPLITSGFYSKEYILSQTYASQIGGFWPWLAGCVGILLTGLYTFRAIFMTFFGEAKSQVKVPIDWRMKLPFGVLSALVLSIGLLQTPQELGGISLFSQFLSPVLPNIQVSSQFSEVTAEWFLILASMLCLVAIGLAYGLYGKTTRLRDKELAPGPKGPIRTWFFYGLGFDAAYSWIWVRAYWKLAQLLAADFFLGIYRFIALMVQVLFSFIRRAQNGRVPNYVSVLAAGVIIFLAIIMVYR